jgi:hypothetical protein
MRCVPTLGSPLRTSTFRRPCARAGAARPKSVAHVAGQPARAARARTAVAHGHRNKAGWRHLAGDGEGGVAGIGEQAVRDADRIAVAGIAVALLGNDRDAPNAVITRHRHARCGGENYGNATG